MRKFLKYAYVGAIALTGFGLASCSSDEDIDNPNGGATGETVKTAFTLSIGSVKSPATKQTRDEAQVDQAFNGMTDIQLFPVATTTTIGDATSLELGSIRLADFDEYTSNLTGAQAKKYTNVIIPVGTTDFLLYGSSKTATNGGLTPNYDPATQVVSSPSGIDNTEDIKFKLDSYNPSGDLSTVTTAGSGVLAALNAVNTTLETVIGTATTDGNTTIKGILETARDNMRYKDGDTYKAFAGSSASILAMVEDLYNSMITLKSTYPGLATYTDAVCDGITATYFDVTADLVQGEYRLSWHNDANSTFPANINLPDGGVAVQWDDAVGEKKFKFVNAVIDGMVTSPIARFVKPAKIYYTINTKGMVRNSAYLDQVLTSDTWTTVKGNYEEGPVKATTRSIILKDQIQYAVARFDLCARVYNGGESILDKNNAIIPEPNNDVYNSIFGTGYASGSGYPITGVLVGGQKDVDWKFTPTTSDEYTIYDKAVQDNATDAGSTIYAPRGESYGKLNTTLVLQSVDATDVMIAVEFLNTGDDFYGVGGQLIAKGTKFYLVGRLKPGTYDSNPGSLTSVFKQDYVTTANVTVKTLANAYNIVPDLRTPKLELGISVDLVWRPGINFSINLQ